MSLSDMLAAQRAAARRRRAARAGQARVPTTTRGQVERVAAVAFGLDFLADLDKLLAARRASLWVVWKGKTGQVYAELETGEVEVLIQSDIRSPVALANLDGEIGHRLLALMRAHDISLVAAFRGGEYVLQAGNTGVSSTWCLTMARCRKGTKAQYQPT